MSTSTAWDRASQRADEVQGGNTFLRLKGDGDRFVGIFIGDPDIEETYYNTKTDRTETYTEQHKAAGLTAQPVFKYNVYVLAEQNDKGTLVELPVKERCCKIFSMKAPTFKELRTMREKFGLDKKIFEVRRHGKKGDTNTRYSIIPEDKVLTPELLAEALNAKRHDLKRVSETEAQTDLASYEKQKASEGEFLDEASLIALIGRLKALPHEKMVRFMTTFGLAQVKALPRAKHAEALRLVDELEGKNAHPAPAAEAPKTVDPFAV